MSERELGGAARVRSRWPRYYADAHGWVYGGDAADADADADADGAASAQGQPRPQMVFRDQGPADDSPAAGAARAACEDTNPYRPKPIFEISIF